MVPYDVSNSLPRFVKHFWDSKSFRQCNVLFTFFPVQRSDFLLSNATFVNPCSSLHLLLSHIYFKQLSSSFINKRIGTIKWTTATFNDTPCPPSFVPPTPCCDIVSSSANNKRNPEKHTKVRKIGIPYHILNTEISFCVSLLAMQVMLCDRNDRRICLLICLNGNCFTHHSENKTSAISKHRARTNNKIYQQNPHIAKKNRTKAS